MMNQPTNADLLDRIRLIESQLDNIEKLVERATGMWLLSKWAAGAMLGLAALWASLHGWWTR